MYPDIYYSNLLRSYKGEKKDHQPSLRDKPSEHKLSLIKTLPVELDGPFAASIYVNDNCDIIFKTEKGTTYYADVPNKLMAKFKIKQDV